MATVALSGLILGLEAGSASIHPWHILVNLLLVVAMPLVFTTVSAALRGYDPALEFAAMTLGANGWQAFRHVTLPMIGSGLAIGGIFAFAISFDELMLALFLASARTETLPRLLWEHLQQTITPVIAAVATLVLLFTVILMGAVLLLRRTDAEAV